MGNSPPPGVFAASEIGFAVRRDRFNFDLFFFPPRLRLVMRFLFSAASVASGGEPKPHWDAGGPLGGNLLLFLLLALCCLFVRLCTAPLLVPSGPAMVSAFALP